MGGLPPWQVDAKNAYDEFKTIASKTRTSIEDMSDV
jgi:hypothetical protein